MVREPDATMQPTLQDNQLMSKHRVLSLKPQLRPEWRGQDGQSETEQPDHSASLCDSITSSTRIRFSVHTTASAVARIDPTLAADIRRSRLPEVFTLNFPRVCDRSCGSRAERASKPICFSPSRMPFFRVSPCCDRRSQLTRGAFSFPIPQVSHLPGRVYRHILCRRSARRAADPYS